MRESLKASNQPKLVEVPTSTGSMMISCRVERSDRARNLKLFLNDLNEVVIKIPKRCSLKYAYEFLNEQGDWLVDAYETAPKKISLAKHLEKNPNFSALGRDYRVILNFTNYKSTITFYEDSRDLCLRYDPRNPESDLVKVLLKFAKEVIPPRVKELAEKVGVNVGRITVRDQSTLWGSCSGNRGISLNWRLILLSAKLHDHIIYHELAHLTEMNHSKRFWDLLTQYDPNTPKNDHSIDKIQYKLMDLGR